MSLAGSVFNFWFQVGRSFGNIVCFLFFVDKITSDIHAVGGSISSLSGASPCDVRPHAAQAPGQNQQDWPQEPFLHQ